MGSAKESVVTMSPRVEELLLLPPGDQSAVLRPVCLDESDVVATAELPHNMGLPLVWPRLEEACDFGLESQLAC